MNKRLPVDPISVLERQRETAIEAGSTTWLSIPSATRADVQFVDCSSVRYTSIRPDDAVSRAAMKTVAAERRRFGYRRIHIMLERQGIVMN